MENKRKRFGNRKDAWRCHDINGLSQILIDLKPKRSLGELYINQKVDVTNLVKYMSILKTKDEKITYFHAFATAIGKVFYNRPLLNRFIANRHVYEHKDVTLSFVMKADFNDKSEEVMVILPILEDDTIFTISKKVRAKVESIRSHQDTKEGANSAIQVLGKLPNILRVPIVGLFKWCDKKGILPAFLVKDNIYYSSIIVSDLGNLKCNGIYHNVTDFGTCSGLITMGEIKEEIVDGKKKYYCEFGITMDERIADGFYFIKSIHLIEYILNNPYLLEEKASEIVEMSSSNEKEKR